jgi:ketosteroid isomerase-like protein
MKKLFSLLLLFLFGVTIIQAQDMSELKSKVQKMNDKYAKMMMNGEMDAMWDGYTDDVISMPSYEPMIKGIDALKESTKKMMESGIKFTAFKSTVTEVMKYDNLVVDIGTYKLTMSIPGMPELWSDHGKYMTLWEVQEDGSMKVKVETWNTDTNPWMDMQSMDNHGEEMGKPEKEESMKEEKQ